MVVIYKYMKFFYSAHCVRLITETTPIHFVMVQVDCTAIFSVMGHTKKCFSHKNEQVLAIQILQGGQVHANFGQLMLVNVPG